MTDNNPQAQTAEAEIRIGKHSIRFSAQFTNETIQLHELLPLFQNITDKVVEIAIAEVREEGKAISCRSGCGACCSQLVPISKAEGMALLELIDAMPASKQTEVRSRFASNLAVLDESGLLEGLERSAFEHDKEQLRALGLAYFGLNLPCPFLHDQSCSIHPQRPLSCREFLVVSDPKHCSEPDPDVVENLVLPRRISPIVYALCQDDAKSDRGFMPLVLLLASAESVRSGQPNPAPAITWVNRFLQRLGG